EPRWLTPIEKLDPKKTESSVVLQFVGQHTLKSLGIKKLTIVGTVGSLRELKPSSKTDICSYCQVIGHSHHLCPAKKAKSKPVCGVCGGNHLTHQHTCPATDCPGGGNCKHQPYYCVSCDSSEHSSIDSSQCPALIAARELHRQLRDPSASGEAQ